MKAKCLFGCLALLGPSLFVWQMSGAQSSEPKERFDYIVRGDFFAGLRGDRAAFDRAMIKTEERLKMDPLNPQALVWHGAGLYADSGRIFAGGDWRKGMDTQKRGLDEMNRAVDLSPTVGVLIPRAATLLEGSKHLRDDHDATATLQKAIADYERVLGIQGAQFAALSVHARGELLGALAEGWYRLGNSEKSAMYLKRLREELPGTAYATRAQIIQEEHPAPANVHITCMGCHVRSEGKAAKTP